MIQQTCISGTVCNWLAASAKAMAIETEMEKRVIQLLDDVKDHIEVTASCSKKSVFYCGML